MVNVTIEAIEPIDRKVSDVAYRYFIELVDGATVILIIVFKKIVVKRADDYLNVSKVDLKNDLISIEGRIKNFL